MTILCVALVLSQLFRLAPFFSSQLVSMINTGVDAFPPISGQHRSISMALGTEKCWLSVPGTVYLVMVSTPVVY